MSKSPAFQFYPGDWLRNDVSGCSLEAQGLWLRMMIVMHDAQIYGQLVLNNEPMRPEFVAKKVGISAKKYLNLLKELEFAGVVNRKENGVIFSGRMERDERARQQNKDRQAHFRETHADDGNGNGNGDVTDESREGNGKVTAVSQRSSIFPLHFPFSSYDFKRLIEFAREEFPKKDPRVIEIAIIETLINRNGASGPINSIHYFADEIGKWDSAKVKEFGGINTVTFDVMLQRRRAQIAKKFQEVG